MNGTAYAPRLAVIATAGLCAILQPAAAETAATNHGANGVTPVPAADSDRAPQGPTVRIPERSEQVESDRPRPDLRDAAASKTTITSDALQSSNSQTTQDALRDVPGVASTDTRGSGTADSLQIRGIKLSSTSSYRLDGGLPIVNNIILSLEDKARVEALKGAGALQFGLASPAGIINYVMKRATNAPVTAFSTSFNSFGQMIGAVDVGRRFGPNNQFGVRVNVAGGEIGSFVNHAGGTRILGSVNLDWRPSERTSFIFDYERFAIDVTEQGAVLLNPATNGRIILPRVPDPTKLRSGEWARSLGYGENIYGKGRVDLGAGFEVVGELGRSLGWRPERNVTQIGNYNIFTGLGRGSATLIQKQETINRYANLELHHTTHWNWIDNLVAVGISRNERDFNNPQNPTYSFAQNIYEPFAVPAPYSPDTRQFRPNNSHDVDYFFRDQIDLFKRVHLLAGVRRIIYESDNTLPNGRNQHTTTRFDAPGFGAIVDITPHISIYASLVKSLEESGQAPVNSANAFTVLPPAPARQKEIGIRLTGWNGYSATLGYFDITRANATTDPRTNIFALNGTIKYQGAEWTALVPVGYGVTLNAGGQYMHAEQISADKGVSGKPPENTPIWSGSGGITWRPRQVQGLTLNVAAQFLGPRPVNPQNQAKLPGTVTFSAGASYAAVLWGHRTSFNLTASNLTDRRYWSSVATGALGIGAPRTITFSLRTEL